MASIFTYDFDPPKVASPWLLPEDSPARKGAQSGNGSSHYTGLLSDYGVTKLEAEPQCGPIEYKLHLLLRPRRAYKSMTTTTKAVGVAPSETKDAAGSTSTGVLGPSQSRQERLHHLTTQLLWRLRQSSPFNASRSKDLAIPRLPGISDDLDRVELPDSLGLGLEESRGALYEIGVADDGTLVGLTRDEMDESMKTLGIMAASLGCSVEVLRTVIVGDCEWIEPAYQTASASESPDITREAKLWVAEALVTPKLGLEPRNGADGRRDIETSSGSPEPKSSPQAVVPSRGCSDTPQLRVTFTGPTTSGKSSLLGTLSTGTLDNGRGKSRLSLLKHQHEVASGVTSSIAHELIGYRGQDIINFSERSIESWIDIHESAVDGRLVLVSDSGGHPRYRRTVLRGLMNWAPHWIMLCIAADDDGETASRSPGATSSAKEILGETAGDVDLVRAHLTLSLKLNVPLAVVITKLDLASKTSLHRTMSKVLTPIKDSGRIPKIAHPDQKLQASNLQKIPQGDFDKVQGIIESITSSGSLTQHVPIVLTSTVKGIGIGLVHALLEGLPLPPTPSSQDYVGRALNPEQPDCLYHIDDTFSVPASYSTPSDASGLPTDRGVVVSGHLRFGSLSVGDRVVVGPFPEGDDESSRGFTPEDKASPGNYGLSLSHPLSSELAKVAMKNAVSASATAGEWNTACIVSIRNLRLPVHRLEAGQAGTIGLVFSQNMQNGSQTPDGVTTRSPRIRRGMVLAMASEHMLETGTALQAASGFTATFHDRGIDSLAVGSFVDVYVASVRAAARVVRISHQADTGALVQDVFSLSEEMEKPDWQTGTRVSVELLHSREWVEMGSPVILLEGGSQDRSGLEGCVGKIVEIVD